MYPVLFCIVERIVYVSCSFFVQYNELTSIFKSCDSIKILVFYLYFANVASKLQIPVI